ncbi:hypothetical protein WA026_018355, partial [Henosepilachna vigintioctopunctata]
AALHGIRRNHRAGNYSELITDMTTNFLFIGCIMSLEMYKLHSDSDKFEKKFGKAKGTFPSRYNGMGETLLRPVY